MASGGFKRLRVFSGDFGTHMFSMRSFDQLDTQIYTPCLVSLLGLDVAALKRLVFSVLTIQYYKNDRIFLKNIICLENKEIYIDMTHTISMEVVQTFVELLCTVTNMLVSIPVN